MQRVALRADPGFIQMLEDAARAQGLSVSEYVRQAVVEKIAREKRR